MADFFTAIFDTSKTPGALSVSGVFGFQGNDSGYSHGEECRPRTATTAAPFNARILTAVCETSGSFDRSRQSPGISRRHLT